MKKNIKITLTLLLLVIIFISSSHLVFKDKKENTKVIEIEELKESKSIAFYKAKEDGTYEEINTMPTSGYKLNEEKSVCSNGVKPKLEGTNSLRLTNMSKGSTNCYLYFDEIFGSAAKKVLGDITNVEEKTEFTGIATSADTGIYSAPDDYGTSYYFRGLEGSLNNWVKFADSYWRIIRINGNGTVRMIYQGAANGNVSSSNKIGETTQIGTSMYNHTYNDNAYVGYMMGIPLNGTTQTANTTSTNSTSYEQAHTNTYDSDAKTQVDSWYKTNIGDKNLSKYIDTNTGFCNDRQTMSGVNSSYGTLGYGVNGTSYSAWGRLYQNKSWKTTQTPTFQCENMTRDLFTHTSANEGNKKLIYPVGLITSDEVIFAGGFGNKDNSTNYLYTNQNYWTMSPHSHSTNGNAWIFIVYSNGNFSNVSVFYSQGLRPVINLRADTKLTGEGSETSPFEVVAS